MNAALLDDRRERMIGIPIFGMVIPLVTGLWGELKPTDALFWVGAALFVGLSFAIWHGNRWLLLRRRTPRDWLERPAQRVALLVAGIVFFTAPLTVAVLATWVAVSGVDLASGQLWVVTLMNVICVVFVAHVYETVLLIKDRESDAVRLERLERSRVEAELLALRRQVDPHFFFNCLNTLEHLIEEDQDRARAFNQDLAAVTRYLLSTSEKQLVPLRDELAFAHRYAALLSIRFGDAFRVEVEGAPTERAVVPPTSLQLLVENAAKHNSFHARAPLTVQVSVEVDRVVVTNRRRERADATGEGLGLKNLAERVRLATGRDLTVEAQADTFRVVVPVAA